MKKAVHISTILKDMIFSFSRIFEKYVGGISFLVAGLQPTTLLKHELFQKYLLTLPTFNDFATL